MTTATEIVSLLSNPSAKKVNTLFCEVSITQALSVATSAEWRFAKDTQAQAWIDDRNAEYGSRRVALLAHIDGEKISRETADKIDTWAAENPYVRPVNQERIDQIEAQLQTAEANVSAAYAKRDGLHAQERFGWDYKANSEDEEYAAMLRELSNAQITRDGLRGQLKLAVGGFLK